MNFRVSALVVIAAMATSEVQAAVLYSEDFSSVTWYTDNPSDGDLYNNGTELGTTFWSRPIAGSGKNGGPFVNNEELVLRGHDNDSVRSAVTQISGTGTETDLILEFDIDIQNHPDTTLHVEVWEGKNGANGLYYADTITPNGTAGSLKTWADATFNQLASATYMNGDEANDIQLSFTRIDTSMDLVVFFGSSRTANFFNSVFVDNVEVKSAAEPVPEPMAIGMLGIASALSVLVRRR